MGETTLLERIIDETRKSSEKAVSGRVRRVLLLDLSSQSDRCNGWLSDLPCDVFKQETGSAATCRVYSLVR